MTTIRTSAIPSATAMVTRATFVTHSPVSVVMGLYDQRHDEEHDPERQGDQDQSHLGAHCTFSKSSGRAGSEPRAFGCQRRRASSRSMRAHTPLNCCSYATSHIVEYQRDKPFLGVIFKSCLAASAQGVHQHPEQRSDANQSAEYSDN